MILKLAIFASIFGSVGLLTWQCYPLWADRISRYQARQVKEAAKKLDSIFIKIPNKNLLLIYSLAPLAAGAIGFLFSAKMLIALISAGFGLLFPTIVIKRLDANRRNRFRAQLVDGLMILSSSLKAGLSLLQSIEALVEEMPAPISQEFALVLRENKMGISLDDSLERFNKRMRSDELNLIIAAISLARETGGNLPQTLSQLTYSMKEKNRLLDKVNTLTTQGKLQGGIMCLLPIVFATLVYSMSPGFFDIMLQHELGRFLLGYAFISQVIGMFLIRKFSKVEM